MDAIGCTGMLLGTAKAVALSAVASSSHSANVNTLSEARALRAYYLASFASVGVFLPFLSPWLVSLGVRGFALGWIAAIRPLTGIVAPVLFGWAADEFGLRGRILRLATIGAFVPFAWLAVTTVFGRRPTLFELWFAIGVSSFFRVPMMTLADVAALEKSAGYGASRVYGSIGFMLATLASGAILDSRSMSTFPSAVALAFFLAFVLSFGLPARVVTTRNPTREDVFSLIRQAGYAVILVVAAIWSLSHVAYDLCISLHMRDLGASPFGTSIGWAIGVVAEIALMSVWDRHKRRLSLHRWLLLGLMATVLRWSALAVADSLSLVLWLQPLHALSFAVVWMALMDLTRETAPPHLLGTAQGLVSTSCAIGATLGMLLFGAVYESHRGPTTFGIAAGIASLAIGVLAAGQAMLRHASHDGTVRTAP